MHNPPSSCFYCPPGYVDREDSQGNVIPGEWRSDSSSGTLQSVQSMGSNTYSRPVSELQDSIMNFLTTPEGEVPWQYAYVHDHGECS